MNHVNCVLSFFVLADTTLIAMFIPNADRCRLHKQVAVNYLSLLPTLLLIFPSLECPHLLLFCHRATLFMSFYVGLNYFRNKAKNKINKYTDKPLPLCERCRTFKLRRKPPHKPPRHRNNRSRNVATASPHGSLRGDGAALRDPVSQHQEAASPERHQEALVHSVSGSRSLWNNRHQRIL